MITAAAPLLLLGLTETPPLSKAPAAPAPDGPSRPAAADDDPPSLPLLLVMTMRATPDGKVVCSATANGSAPEVESCPEDLAAPMIAHARATGRAAEEAVTMTMTPEGDSEPADRADRGRLVYDSEVVASFAADGSVLECRLVRQQGTPTAKDWPPGPCLGMEPGVTIFGPGAHPPMTVKTRRFLRY